MLVFRSASRPAAGLALAISLSLHGGPWRARGQWGCQVNVQNDIPGVGIQVTTFDADDGVCDDYYGQYAVAPGLATSTPVYCAGDSCKITIAASGWGNFNCPSLKVPCDDVLFFYVGGDGQVATCYSSGDCYYPTPPPDARLLEEAAPDKEEGASGGADKWRGLLRGGGGGTAAAAAAAPVSEDGR